jgi:hypothetical protein
MKARIAALSTFLTFSAALAAGADPQLLNMVMPDAQVMAGVNVEQAKTTPFGQWVLARMQPSDGEFQKMSAAIGFDPRRDVRELLVATAGGADARAGLVLARGAFDVARITAAAKTAGAPAEPYRGATFFQDPKKRVAFAVVDASTVVAGTPELVRAALDRRGRTNSSISPALAAKVNQLSTTLDAWAITLVPPSSLQPPRRQPASPQAQQLMQQDAFQKIQQASGGVTFGANIAFTGEAVAATEQDAVSLGQVLQFLANMAATQAQNDPSAAALVKGLTVNAQGQTLKVALSLPHSQFEQLVQPRQNTGRQRRVR